MLVLQWAASSVLAAPLLWQVDDDRSGGRAYLFGSIHVGRTNMYPLPEVVLRAFEASEVLVVELDPAAIEPAEAGRMMAEHGRYPLGTNLENHLDAGTWQELLVAAAALNVPVQQLRRLKPWLVAVQLAAAQMRQVGYIEEYGIDRYFIEAAKASAEGRSIVELETFEEQLSLFSGLSHGDQLQLLRQALDEFERGPEFSLAIIDAWQAGDEERLNRVIKETFVDADSSRLYQLIFAERNHRMQKAVAARLMQGQALFVVVGAGHMVGEDGIKALLRASGFRFLTACMTLG